MKDSIWNNNPAKLLKECKRLRALCLRIIDEEESVILGSQHMGKYRFWMKEEKNPGWEVFSAVNERCVHLPVGDERIHWDCESLKAKDFELKEIEESNKTRVIEAARKIRNEYKNLVEQIR